MTFMIYHYTRADGDEGKPLEYVIMSNDKEFNAFDECRQGYLISGAYKCECNDSLVSTLPFSTALFPTAE